MIILDSYEKCIILSDFIIEAEHDFDCVLHIYNDESTIVEMAEIIDSSEPIHLLKKYRKRYLGDRLIFCIVGSYLRTDNLVYVSYVPN